MLFRDCIMMPTNSHLYDIVGTILGNNEKKHPLLNLFFLLESKIQVYLVGTIYL